MRNANEILGVLSHVKEDNMIPKNVKQKIEDILDILNGDIDSAVKTNKILQELDDIADDPNMPSHARTQIWNVATLLETA